jgi:hypothetical protein
MELVGESARLPGEPWLPTQTIDTSYPTPAFCQVRINLVHAGLIPSRTSRLNHWVLATLLFSVFRGRELGNFECMDLIPVCGVAILSKADQLVPEYD